MIIAVTYEDGKVFPHFGHTAQFKFYRAEDGEILSSRVMSTNGSGHGALAGFLKEAGADVLICGGIGGGARTALDAAGITVYGGVSGSADAAAQALAAGKLVFDPQASCTNHAHAEQHSCSGHDNSHGCAGHCDCASR